MTSNKPAYKSYCWSIGTTSFRHKYMNKSIEEQLLLLDEFWSKDENKDFGWSSNPVLQSRFYYFLKDEGFLKGNAPRPDKDARQKLSGSVCLGLINDEKRLTQVGYELVELVKNNDFKSDNDFLLPKDSYIFTKQLLKLSVNVEGCIIRPFIILIYLITQLRYLSYDEFTYFLPLCIDAQTTFEILSYINDFRQGNLDLDEAICDIVLSKLDYPLAYTIFMNNKVTEKLICNIGMNRKSRNDNGIQYDKLYFPFYLSLRAVCVEKDYSKLVDVLDDINKLKNNKVRSFWKKYLFTSTSKTKMKSSQSKTMANSEIYRVKDEREFKDLFFKKMHLFKIKTTLHDYKDLNVRYFKITDLFLFGEDSVKLDIIPEYYFKDIASSLIKDAFSQCNLLHENVCLEQISQLLTFNKSAIYSQIRQKYGIEILNEDNIKNIANEERLKRFNSLIDNKFDDETLLKLLIYFEERNDSKIEKLVNCEATIPTIFEYIIGIIWYKISERKGNILDFMKLSLDSNLMPKTHAVGGDADIVYMYEKSPYFPEHSLLLEVTLSERDNQRRMEMEPVSRHLGEYLLKNPNKNSYCIFTSTYLHSNVISDFRNRKTYTYCDDNCPDNYIEGLKIIPLQTSELYKIIKTNKKYKDIYKMLDDAYYSEHKPIDWYEKNIICNL